MEIIADKVHPDEACYGYFTGPRVMPGYQEAVAERMVEFVFVVRGDAIAKYVQDFGPASEYPYIPPMMMPSFGENPVGLMQEFGEKHRHDDRWAKRIREYKESSTLYQDILRQEQELHELIHNRSTFGPIVSTQRNGYPREAVWRRWMDKRAARTGKRQF